METISRANANADSQPTSVPNAGQVDVAVLGQPPASGQSEVHPETETEGNRPTGKINVKTVLQLLSWQDYRCALTGRQLSPEEASLDHIVPVRDGGEHVIENTQILHRDINRAKSILSNGEFIEMCRDVVSHLG